MTTIAGHVFGLEGRCSCGKRFSDVSGATPQHVGTHGIAHTAHLTAAELGEIQAEVQRIWNLLVGSATGNGPATTQEPDYSGAEAA